MAIKTRDINSKFRKFNMADGCHIANGQIAISPRKTIRFWWTLVHNSTFWNSTVTWLNMIFLFNLGGTRHIENRFLAINQQPIAQFQLNIAVFHIIAAMKQIPAFHITYFCFSNAVWVSASGGFGIVSNTFFVYSGHDSGRCRRLVVFSCASSRPLPCPWWRVKRS